MATTITLVVLAHAAALAGVLLTSRHSRLLVDEQGRPLTDAWHEATIPVAVEAELPR